VRLVTKNVHHGGTEDTETTIDTEIAEIAERIEAASIPCRNRSVSSFPVVDCLKDVFAAYQ